EQSVVGQSVFDELGALLVFLVQVVLIDILIRTTADRRIDAILRIGVALDRIEGDGLGALDDQPGAGVDGDIAMGRRILALTATGGGRSAIAADTRRIEFQGATGLAIALPRLGRGAVTQVDAR